MIAQELGRFFFVLKVPIDVTVRERDVENVLEFFREVF